MLEAKDDTIVPASNYVDKETFGTRVVHFPIYVYFGPGLRESGLLAPGIAVFWIIGSIHEGWLGHRIALRSLFK